MKTFSPRPILALLFFATCASLLAQQDIDITTTRKKLDEKRMRESGNTTVITKDIVFDVTLKNKTFKPLADLDVKYMIFYKDPKPGSTDKATEIPSKGAEKIASIGPNGSATFATQAITLTSSQLDGNWYYSKGGGNKTEDRVTGIWFRVYSSDGKMIGEYSNPSTISKRQTWQE